MYLIRDRGGDEGVSKISVIYVSNISNCYKVYISYGGVLFDLPKVETEKNDHGKEFRNL